jgi:hypothetical protein
MTIVRTTFQAPELLLHRLKVQAAKEQTDVSRLLCKAAEAYLATQEHRDLTEVRAEARVARERARAPGYAGRTPGQPAPRRGPQA